MSDDATKPSAQDPKIVEGATTGDIEEEVAPAANSAEDRKAAAALSSLDATRDDDTSAKNVDQDAVKKAMDRLAGTGGASKKTAEKKEEVKKAVKVDAADVTLVVSCSAWMVIPEEYLRREISMAKSPWLCDILSGCPVLYLPMLCYDTLTDD